MNPKAIEQHINFLKSGTFFEKMLATKALKPISEKNPETLIPYFNILIELLKSDNNKVKWAVICLLSPLTPIKPKLLFTNIDLFARLAEGPSVIVRDQYVKILASLACLIEYADTALTLLIDEVLKAPINQLPSYADIATKVVDKENALKLKQIIVLRLPDVAALPAKTKKLKQTLNQLDKKLK